MTINFWPVFWTIAILWLILGLGVTWWVAILVVLVANIDAHISWS